MHVFSVTKNITSLLVGMALDQGYIESADNRRHRLPLQVPRRDYD